MLEVTTFSLLLGDLIVKCFICLIAFCIVAALTTRTGAQDKVLAKEFSSPLKDEKWKPSRKFGEEVKQDKISYGKSLGEEQIFEKPGAPVLACADGYLRIVGDDPGTPENPGRGKVMCLGHWLVKNKVAIYSVYGRIEPDESLTAGEFVKRGQQIGKVAKAGTPENGHWKETCLRFQFLLDPKDKFLFRMVPEYYDHYRDEDKKLLPSDAPYRLPDHIAPSEVLSAKDPVALLIKEEANPKRR